MKTACVLSAFAAFLSAESSYGALVLLQNATATYSQEGMPVSLAINGNPAQADGWALWDGLHAVTAQTAAFETVADIDNPGGTELTFSLLQNWGGFTIRRFRLSVTTDDRSEFADGLPGGGDVTANWTVLSPFSYSSVAGASLSKRGDDSVVAGPPGFPGVDTYIVTANTSLRGITGFRLEVMEDPDNPDIGPGYGNLYNLVLNEFTVDATPIPEPSGLGVLAALGLVAFSSWRRTAGGSARG